MTASLASKVTQLYSMSGATALVVRKSVTTRTKNIHWRSKNE